MQVCPVPAFCSLSRISLFGFRSILARGIFRSTAANLSEAGSPHSDTMRSTWIPLFFEHHRRTGERVDSARRPLTAAKRGVAADAGMASRFMSRLAAGRGHAAEP